MDKNTKKAILVVSFGTSVNETREKTIDCIEADIREANPDASIYRAWTSKMIIRKLKNRDGVTIHTVKEAMEAMIRGRHQRADCSAHPHHQRNRK